MLHACDKGDVSIRPTLLLVAVFAIVAGCEDKKASPPTPPAATAATATATAVTTATPSAAATVAAQGKMAHCPNIVPGTTTVVSDVEGGVDVTVTGKDDAATADIRARVKALLDAVKHQGATVKHTGQGEGGGLLGRCPIVLRDTTVDAADVDRGSKITVKAKEPKYLDWLRRETRERNAELTAPNADGAGIGKMAHCPSAVEGADTKVTDTKDGVSVVVTAKADGATKQIRDRAKQLADVSRKAPAAVKHDGSGTGGGSLGRCPVVVRDTVVDTKDVAGGSQITVKAKKAESVTTIQKESKDRAAKFQL
jgi:hypothetical protein